VTEQNKGKKIGLYVGVGCLALSGMCCAGMAAAVYVPKMASDSTAEEKAEAFLGHLQRRDYAAAFSESEYLGSTDLYTSQQFQTCYEATVLADMTSYECDGVDSTPFSNEGDVTCEVTSAAHGTSEITVHVNSTDSRPYLGFVWFSPGAYMGEAWHSGSCSRWSGKEYFQDPPAGRVRP
jgi:hypothetical protein